MLLPEHSPVWENIPHAVQLSTASLPNAVPAVNSGEPGAVLARVLHVLRPLVRPLVHQGVTYPALAAALKRIFLDEARRELQRRGMVATDSALTLLSGVHRRDVRKEEFTEKVRGNGVEAALRDLHALGVILESQRAKHNPLDPVLGNHRLQILV